MNFPVDSLLVGGGVEENEVRGQRLGARVQFGKRMKRNPFQVEGKVCIGCGGKEADTQGLSYWISESGISRERVEHLLTQVALGTWGVVGSPYRAAINIPPPVT